MDTITLRLKIEKLRAKVELCRIACESLERAYSHSDRTLKEMEDIAHRWGEALKTGNSARIELDQLEREPIISSVGQVELV